MYVHPDEHSLDEVLVLRKKTMCSKGRDDVMQEVIRALKAMDVCVIGSPYETLGCVCSSREMWVYLCAAMQSTNPTREED